MVTRRNVPKASHRKRTTNAASARRARAKSPRKRRKARAARVNSRVRKARRKSAAPRARPRTATGPSADRERQLRADRERLGLGRGEDMTVAAADMELRADRQISRDAVHEREISGS